MVTVTVRDVEARQEAAQYGGSKAERDVGPPTEPARAAEDAGKAEERRQDENWLADPEDAALAAEVISPSEKSRDIRDKADWYAVARVPVLLVIDPRKATWTLHTRPDDGAYQDVLPGKFGEPVPLPEPLHGDVATGDFPVYG
ncbi:Uma2 family endonuclease [Streptomyces sp. NPDC004232]|uniref:Uma2 family endonuclease n=1 Tax=Streptomyces sp. NPDC004232 TaxID=3154454 RepID=UPI001DFA4AD8|nr:Uma2 family endonuclease [Streptomyces sp. tea 10]